MNFNPMEKPQTTNESEEIKKRAYKDIERRLSGNPSDLYTPGTLRESDAGYIEKVIQKVEEKLMDKEYVEDQKRALTQRNNTPETFKAHDPGFKAGNGILEAHNKTHTINKINNSI